MIYPPFSQTRGDRTAQKVASVIGRTLQGENHTLAAVVDVKEAVPHTDLIDFAKKRKSSRGARYGRVEFRSGRQDRVYDACYVTR